MENLAHVVTAIGTVKKWHEADPQWYYGAGYHDEKIKVFKCSNCGKVIGQYKLLYGNYCPNCSVKFEGEMSDGFTENCNKLIAHLKKEKKKIDKKINSKNYKELGEKIEDINWCLELLSRSLKEWLNNEIPSRFDKCQELYSKMVNGNLIFSR